ncbi:MAG: DMT family transporter [Actinomycetota bacterium]
MIYGLTAALAWGTGDFLAALSSRRIGLQRTVVVSQLCATLALAVAGVAFRERFATPAPGLLDTAGVGLILTAAYLFLYRGLQLGPVALVSPLAAASSAVTVVMAVAILGEILRWPAEAALVVILGGVVLASAPVGPRPRRARFRQAGTAFGLGACAALGAFSFCIAVLSRRYGWFPVVFGTHVVAATLFCGWFAFRRPSVPPGLGALSIIPAAAIGVLDAVATSAFARGTEVGSVSLVTAVASAFPLVPMVCGLVILGERPHRTQIAGAVCVVGGLIALGTLV